MSRPLNEKQRKACRELIKGGTQTEAYIRAGYAVAAAKSGASVLFLRPEAQEYLEKLRAPKEEDARNARQAHLAELAAIRDEARADKQYGPAVTAETNRGKVEGLYTEKVEHSGGIDFRGVIEVVKSGS